jgi:hypothetical protein
MNVRDLIKVIFENFDLILFKCMCEVGGVTRQIKIIFMFYLDKCRLWFCSRTIRFDL